MERQEIGKNKISSNDNDISLKVFCLTPTVTASEEHDTSVYEIDIQSDFEFHSSRPREKKFPVGVSISKGSGKKSESGKKEAKGREHTTPFFQAYYPNVLHPHIEENETQSQSVRENETQSETVRESETQSETVRENETQSETVRKTETQSERVKEAETQSQSVREIETQSETVKEAETQSEAVEQNEESQMILVEGKKESAEGKVDKENQSPSVDNNRKLQKHMKSFIIENFFSKNKNDLKAMFKNYENKLDTNELHLHHHEHHHHYYFDGSFMTEKSSTSNSKKEQSKSKRSRENRYQEEKIFENINQTNNYVSQCSSNLTFTHVKVTPEDSSKPKDEESKEPEESSDHISLPMKSSMSMESLVLKKSDFIKSHVYSDTDLTKCESQEVEPSVRESRKSSRSNYSVLVNSLKSLNQLRSPIIITDQQTVPKFSYITCECTSVDTLGNMSSISLFSSDHYEENLDETERTSCESLESRKSSDARKIEVKKSERKLFFDHWKAHVKLELKQIKEELRRFEKAHFKTEDPISVEPRIQTEAPETGADHKIAVYSSKTFIMGSQDVRLRKNRPNCKNLLMSENRKGYEESVWKTSMRSADRKANLRKKRMYSSLRTGALQRI